jgi:antitoxin (DNA-binding transcriptional repressor) of toxin-antitoxin stability system
VRTATVAEAKEKLEELIAAARAGETVEITADGDAVAELQAVSGSRRRTPARHPRHRELLDSDVITIGTGAPPTLEGFPPGSVPSGVLDALLEERREGR